MYQGTLNLSTPFGVRLVLSLPKGGLPLFSPSSEAA